MGSVLARSERMYLVLLWIAEMDELGQNSGWANNQFSICNCSGIWLVRGFPSLPTRGVQLSYTEYLQQVRC